MSIKLEDKSAWIEEAKEGLEGLEKVEVWASKDKTEMGKQKEPMRIRSSEYNAETAIGKGWKYSPWKS